MNFSNIKMLKCFLYIATFVANSMLNGTFEHVVSHVHSDQVASVGGRCEQPRVVDQVIQRSQHCWVRRQIDTW